MLCALKNPHRHGLASSLETASSVKPCGFRFRHQHVLVKSAVAIHEAPHDFSADALALILREDEKMRIVNHKTFVRNRVAKADK